MTKVQLLRRVRGVQAVVQIRHSAEVQTARDWSPRRHDDAPILLFLSPRIAV